MGRYVYLPFRITGRKRFGESLILHREHLLEDIHSHRPIFVKYQTPVPYIIEGIIVILLCMGFGWEEDRPFSGSQPHGWHAMPSFIWSWDSD